MRPQSATAWRRFHEQVEARGGRVIEPRWLGNHQRHRIICGEGHEAAPRPSDVNQGVGICRPCSGTDPATVEQAFRALIAERGGIVVEPLWLGAKKPHRIICAEGHETTPRPSDVLNKATGCIACVGKDQSATWQLFCRIIAERGGRVLEPKPLGTNTPHRVLCPEGHQALAIPVSVRNGLSMCRECGATSTLRAEREFRTLVASLGGRIIEPSWIGVSKPHRVVCAEGHETTPRPSEARLTKSICRVCSGHCSETSWREFKARVAELGGTVIEPEWLGNKKAHRIICGAGHKTKARPNNVDQGNGICRFCKCKVWDIFYVVTNDATQTVKFGVTSHDAKARLRFHQGDGFSNIVTTITGLPGAADLERAVMATLQLAGVPPVRGREYYDLSALPVILDIADNWSSTHDSEPSIPAADESRAGSPQAAAEDRAA